MKVGDIQSRLVLRHHSPFSTNMQHFQNVDLLTFSTMGGI